MAVNKYGIEKKTSVKKVRDVTWARTVKVETKNISAAGSGNHLHIHPQNFPKNNDNRNKITEFGSKKCHAAQL